jgi:hypothetical protein
MYEKAKQFVQKHQTTVACGATALVTWKLTRDAALKQVMESITPMSYQWGVENGILAIQNTVMLDFIKANGQQDQLREFVREIKEVVDGART